MVAPPSSPVSSGKNQQEDRRHSNNFNDSSSKFSNHRRFDIFSTYDVTGAVATTVFHQAYDDSNGEEGDSTTGDDEEESPDGERVRTNKNISGTEEEEEEEISFDTLMTMMGQPRTRPEKSRASTKRRAARVEPQ